MASRTGNFVNRVAAGMFAVAAAVMPSQSHSDEVKAQNALYQHDKDTPELVLAQAKQDTTKCTPCNKTNPDDVIYAVNGVNGGTVLPSTDSKFASVNLANALFNSKMNALFYVTDNAGVETKEIKALLRAAKAMNRDPAVIKAGAQIDMVMQVYPERDSNGQIVKDSTTGESINNTVFMLFGKGAGSVQTIPKVAYDIKYKESTTEPILDSKGVPIATLIRSSNRAEIALLAYATKIVRSSTADIKTGQAADQVYAQKMSYAVVDTTGEGNSSSGGSAGSAGGDTDGSGSAGKVVEAPVVLMPSI